MSAPPSRRGCGLVAGLPPGGGLRARDTVLGRAGGKAVAAEFPEFYAAHAAAIKDIDTRYRAIKKLRDDALIAREFEGAGVTLSDEEERLAEGKYGTYPYTVQFTDVPTLSGVYITRSGLELVYENRPKDSVERWRKTIPTLKGRLTALGFDPSKLEITNDDSYNIVLSFNDIDPFSTVEITSGTFDAARGRSLLGITEDGDEAWITWAGSSGMVIGGVPGSGKTASLLPVFAGMAGKAELYVFDGKTGYDLHPLRHIARVYDRSGDIDAPLATLRTLETLRTRRAEALYTALGQNNFWNVPVADRERIGLVPIFVVLDEVQTWLDQSGMSKDEREISAEITRLVRTLIQKARSVGIVTVLTTQKPDSTSIPTVIRDNAALKVAFRVSTPEQAVTILGKQAANAPDPTHIPMAAKGRAVMETEGRGIVLLQAGYTSPEDLDAALASATRAPDQFEVADRLLGGKPMSNRPRFEEAVREPDTEPVPAAASVITEPEPRTVITETVGDVQVSASPDPGLDDEEDRLRREMLVLRVRMAQKRGLIPADIDPHDEDAVLNALADAQRRARTATPASAPTTKGWD
ncbi:hypothetical protein DKM27_18480 [Mycobacterium tuberculosis variant bovis]|nr:hypothetical protein DKM27_18480 [Mycobacterium tuberculosis variant bovis]